MLFYSHTPWTWTPDHQINIWGEEVNVITVHERVSDSVWRTKKLLYYNNDKFRKALQLIKEDLGFEETDVIVNYTYHPLNDYDQMYKISKVTLWAIEDLADNVIIEDP